MKDRHGERCLYRDWSAQKFLPTHSISTATEMRCIGLEGDARGQPGEVQGTTVEYGDVLLNCHGRLKFVAGLIEGCAPHEEVQRFEDGRGIRIQCSGCLGNVMWGTNGTKACRTQSRVSMHR
jgi:hypothetical protein